MRSDLKDRTKKFSMSVIDLVEQLPNTIACRAIANQLVRSGTSVGANYRAVCRARSDKEFIEKMDVVLEESDEVCFWMELIQEKKWLSIETTEPTLKEANELTAIFVSTLKTMNTKRSNNSNF